MIATFKTSDFVANLKAALLAVQTDEARMHQCQVRIELAAGVARFVATNGHWAFGERGALPRSGGSGRVRKKGPRLV